MNQSSRRRPAGTGWEALVSTNRRLWILLALVMIILVLGLTRLVGLLPSFENPFASEKVDRTQPALLEAIENLAEYRAASGHFQVIIDVEDDTRFVPSFIRGERTVFLAGGTVDASVDFTGLAEGAVERSEDGTAVTVRLPSAHLSEPRIDPERSYVVSRDRGLLDRAGSAFSDNPTSDRELYLQAEQKLSAAAVEAGLTERAEANTRAMLESMLASLGFDEVTVVFDQVPVT